MKPSTKKYYGLEVLGTILLLLHRFEGRLVPASDLPLRTQGRDLVTSTELSRVVRLDCVNWYGSHMKDMVPNGLNRLPLADIARTVVDFGFNCVRLPFSLEMVFTNLTQVPRPETTLGANPEMKQLSPLEVFDWTVHALADAGLLVILNNHISGAGWCCEEDDGEGLWHTEEYPEEAWLDALGLMAARYVDEPMVVGFDIRNELREAHGVLPTWGTGDAATDWAAAADRGGRRVLAANARMLVFVSGLHFAMLLQCVPSGPLHEAEVFRGRLVYVAHDYEWYHFGPEYYERLAEPTRLAPLVAGAVSALALLSFLLPIPPRLLCGRVPFWEVLLLALLSSSALACLSLLFIHRRSCAVDEYMMRDGALLSLRLLAAPIGILLARRLALCVAGGGLPSRCRRRGRAGAAAQEEEPEAKEPRIGGAAAPAASAEAVPHLDDEGSDVAKVSVSASLHPGVVMHGRRLRCWVGAFIASWQFALIASAVCAVFVLRHERAAYLDYEFYESEWDRRFGFLLTGSGTSQAPVWLNEFGTKSETNWWHYVNRYIREHDVDYAYWALNGEKKAYSWVEPYGLLKSDSKTVRHPWKLDTLQRLRSTSSPR